MIKRDALTHILHSLKHQAAVAMIGPRQVGKTTLARNIANQTGALYLDLEQAQTRQKLSDPESYFQQHQKKLIVLDEIHYAPNIFSVLRSHIDQQRQTGFPNGQFLILGSAAINLLQQSSQSLAGRITFVDISSLSLHEATQADIHMEALWLRGGFPNSLLAATDADSMTFRQNFIRTYLERDIPQFGPRIPAERLRRLWTMLAHNQGQLLNSAQLANSLEVSAPTIHRYIDLLVDLLLVRRLEPLHANIKKRLIKSPKLYIRDSGLLHALLNINNAETLSGHSVIGASWEGFVIEALLTAAPRFSGTFYRTRSGNEVDLCLDLGGNKGRWLIEVKRGVVPKVSKGLHQAITDLTPQQTFVVYAGDETYPLGKNIRAIGLTDLIQKIRD